MSQALGQLGNFQFSPELARPPHALAARTPIGEPPFFFFFHILGLSFSTSSLTVCYSKSLQFGGHYYILKPPGLDLLIGITPLQPWSHL